MSETYTYIDGQRVDLIEVECLGCDGVGFVTSRSGYHDHPCEDCDGAGIRHITREQWAEEQTA